MKIMVKRKTYETIEKYLIIGVILIVLGITSFVVFSIKQALNS